MTVYLQRSDGRTSLCTKHTCRVVLQWLAVRPWHVDAMVSSIWTQLLSFSTDKIDWQQWIQVLLQVILTRSYMQSVTEWDIERACDFVLCKRAVCLLIGGTSGSGKSTLASLLASRLGIRTVLSTDHLRHMLRTQLSQETLPVLFASSYHAGDALTPLKEESYDDRIIRGFEEQNALLFATLCTLIKQFLERNESLLIEGVHLSVQQTSRLLSLFPHCIPFLLYISNATKHAERFAIRAKYMTLAVRQNRYIQWMDNIRMLQDYLCKAAKEAMMPAVDNTNVDRTVALIHRVLLATLKHWDSVSGKSVQERCEILDKITLQVQQETWSSKTMLLKIRAKTRQRKRALSDVGPDSVSLPPPSTLSQSTAADTDWSPLVLSSNVPSEALDSLPPLVLNKSTLWRVRPKKEPDDDGCSLVSDALGS